MSKQSEDNPNRVDLDPGFAPEPIEPYDPAAMTPEERKAMNERFWAERTPGWRPAWMGMDRGTPLPTSEEDPA